MNIIVIGDTAFCAPDVARLSKEIIGDSHPLGMLEIFFRDGGACSAFFDSKKEMDEAFESIARCMQDPDMLALGQIQTPYAVNYTPPKPRPVISVEDTSKPNIRRITKTPL